MTLDVDAACIGVTANGLFAGGQVDAHVTCIDSEVQIERIDPQRQPCFTNDFCFPWT